MDGADLAARIAQRESASLELKSVRLTSGLLDPNDAAKSIAGLANSGGGLLVAGVEKDRTITGVPDADKLIQQLVHIC